MNARAGIGQQQAQDGDPDRRPAIATFPSVADEAADHGAQAGRNGPGHAQGDA